MARLSGAYIMIKADMGAGMLSASYLLGRFRALNVSPLSPVMT